MPGVDLSWIFVRESQLSDTFGSSWENDLRLEVTHFYQNERVEILTEKKNRLPHDVQLFATSWTLPGSSVHGILQARTQEWVAIPLSRGSS